MSKPDDGVEAGCWTLIVLIALAWYAAYNCVIGIINALKGGQP